MDRAEFDRFADEHHRLHSANIRASGEGPEVFACDKIEDMARVWRARLGARPVRGILDFGGGVGTSAPHLSELFPEARITLADVSERSLEIAAARRVPRVETLLSDGARLPLADAGVDAALDACVFHHIPGEAHVPLMAEIRRVLRPGALLFVFEHNPWNPLTRRAVDTCPFDEKAVLIAGPELRRRMRAACFAGVDLARRIFVPGALRALRQAERALERLPLGAQYRAVGAA